VAVSYTFVGLSEGGNRDIGVMTEASYEQKMKRWQGWINTYLSSSRTWPQGFGAVEQRDAPDGGRLEASGWRSALSPGVRRVG